MRETNCDENLDTDTLASKKFTNFSFPGRDLAIFILSYLVFLPVTTYYKNEVKLITVKTSYLKPAKMAKNYAMYV